MEGDKIIPPTFPFGILRLFIISPPTSRRIWCSGRKNQIDCGRVTLEPAAERPLLESRLGIELKVYA